MFNTELVSLILKKTLTSNKVALLASNLLNFPELVVNELKKSSVIYSSERSERSFHFGFLKGDAYSREALIKYTKKTSKYFQFVSLIKQ